MTHTLGRDDPSYAAVTPVLLSTQPNVVQWPHALPPHKTLMFRTQTIARDGKWSGWLRCPPRGSLFGSRLRSSVTIPPTHYDGRLEVRPFLLRDDGTAEGSEDEAYSLDTTNAGGVGLRPAGGLMRFILLNNPIVVEEALMFLEETSKVQRSSSGKFTDGLSGSVRNGGFLSSFFGRARTPNELSTSGRSHRGRNENDHGDPDDDDSIQNRRRSRRIAGNQNQSAPRRSSLSDNDSEHERQTERMSELDRELARVSNLMFDDSIGVSVLRSGCEDAALAGLLHLLRIFGNKAIQAIAGDRDRRSVETLEQSLPPSKVMENVAASGCADTLRTLVRLIGIAEDCATGLGDLLFGNPEIPALSDNLNWLPLHTAAVTSCVISKWDSVAAVEFVCMMIGSCSNPMLWMGVGYENRQNSRRSRQSAGDGSEHEHDVSERSFISSTSGIGFSKHDGFGPGGPTDRRSGFAQAMDKRNERNVLPRVPKDPPQMLDCDFHKNHEKEDVGFPAEYAPDSVCLGVRDFYEAAVTVAVVHAGHAAAEAVASATAQLVQKTQGTNSGGAEYLAQLGALVRPPLLLDDVIEQCMSSSLSDSRLSWMACNLLSDELCRQTLLAIYDSGAAAAVWRPFPQQHTVRALMHCLGWLDETLGYDMLYPDMTRSQVVGGQQGGDESLNDRVSEGGSFFGSGNEHGRQRAQRNNARTRDGDANPVGSIDEHQVESEGLVTRGEGFLEKLKRVADSTARPLFSQTPWNTGRLGFMAFKDEAVEKQWLQTREMNGRKFERRAFFLLFVVFLVARLLNGDLHKLLALEVDESITLLIPKFHTVLFALGVTFAASKTYLLSPDQCPISTQNKQWLVCVLRFANAMVNVPEVFPSRFRGAEYGDCRENTGMSSQSDSNNCIWTSFDMGDEYHAPRSVFDPAVWSINSPNPQHLIRLGFVILNAGLPFLVNVSFKKHGATSLVCSVFSKLRFGMWHGCQNIHGFDSGYDLIIRATTFVVLSASLYIREYHDRFSFLMRFFAPGKAKIA